MASLVFPARPPGPLPRPTPVVRVVRREPLAAIRELLGICIHDVVNDLHSKRVVGDLYRISRSIENETWLRRRLAEQEAERWIARRLW